jgi:hypothetical protein
MAKLEWDKTGERLFETGTKNGVLYVYDSSKVSAATGPYTPGVAWNGLTGVTESPSGAEATALYADDIKYLNLYSAEELGATINAYTYPDEFAVCDGSEAVTIGTAAPMSIGQQSRKTFGLCYRTALGNDTDGQDHGYKLHLLYGCKASPSERSYETVNDSPSAITFSWTITTTPVTCVINNVTYKPTALITIDSTKCTAAGIKALEDALYGVNAGTGTEAADPYLPLPAKVYELLSTTGQG